MRDWKHQERRIATLLGGQRVPVTGRARGDAPDIEHGMLSIEVKARARLPALLTKAMSQAVAAVRGDQIPFVVLHQWGDPWADDMVVLRMSDWLDLHGPVGGRTE